MVDHLGNLAVEVENGSAEAFGGLDTILATSGPNGTHWHGEVAALEEALHHIDRRRTRLPA